MQQHPIPQNVTAYEFHLIGNMTIKQFIELGVGVGGGIFFYSTPLPDYVKWPLVIGSVVLGAAMAFLPFDGRPLDRMVIIFFRAVYSPTQYIWRKSADIPSYFNYVQKKAGAIDPTALEKQRLRKNLNEYLDTLPGSGSMVGSSELDSNESNYIQTVNQLFASSQAPQQVTPSEPQLINTTAPKVRVRAMKPEAELKTNPQSLEQTLQSVSIEVPENIPVEVPQQIQAPEVVTSPKTNESGAQPQAEAHNQVVPQQHQTTQVTTNQDLPFPQTPTQPNVLVGMVLTPEGKIIDNAIVEIQDKNGMPVRALKTNSLGQFFTATQLPKGQYQILVEKSGLSFDIMSIDLKNKVVPPLEIRAKA